MGTKLVIVEGLDRTGKDTLINSLLKKYPNSKMVHWGYPEGNTNQEKTDYQIMSFGYYMREYEFLKIQNNLDLIIWNRSHIGECVYGPLYRESDPQWIFDLEKEFLADSNNVYLVYLHGDVEFLLKNDDGESFTTDLNKKLHEQSLFNEAVNQSQITNKIKIKVNDGNNYIDKSGICSTVTRFIDK